MHWHTLVHRRVTDDMCAECNVRILLKTVLDKLVTYADRVLDSWNTPTFIIHCVIGTLQMLYDDDDIG